MLRWMLLRSSESAWFGRRVPNWKVARGAVRRFMPGESLEEAIDACSPFQRKGMGNILTYLGENVTTDEEAHATTSRYVEALDQFSTSGMDLELSVKLSQIGLDQCPELCGRNLHRIVSRATERGGAFVWIDMESSRYVDRTLERFRAIRERHANVGVCLQAYLHRTADDLESLLPLAPAIRLVKGAYAESKRIAFPRKRDVDENFLRLSNVLLSRRKEDGRTRTAIATHDPVIISEVIDLADRTGLQQGEYEFQLLYGIQATRQDELAKAGHRVGVLISYGDAWFPWFMRRLAERPANVVFLAKNLFS